MKTIILVHREIKTKDKKKSTIFVKFIPRSVSQDKRCSRGSSDNLRHLQ